MLPLILALCATFWHGNVAEYPPLAQMPHGIGAQAQQCSFIEEMARATSPPANLFDATSNYGSFSAIWHTNCTDNVNFVINYKNFPQYGSFWIGIGFKLIDTVEMALIEVINGNVVTISSAKYYRGQAPQRSDGLLLNAEGTVFIGNVLEATFTIAESILSGCKEWTFFTKPTPIGSPYTVLPYQRLVCNIARDCSRFDCEYQQPSSNYYFASQYYRNDNIPPPITNAESTRQIGRPLRPQSGYDDCYDYYYNNPSHEYNAYYNDHCPVSQYVVNGAGSPPQYNVRNVYGNGNSLANPSASDPNNQRLYSPYLDYYRKNAVAPPLTRLLDSTGGSSSSIGNNNYNANTNPYNTYQVRQLTYQPQRLLPPSNQYIQYYSVPSLPSNYAYYSSGAQQSRRVRRSEKSSGLKRKRRNVNYMALPSNRRLDGTAYEGQDRSYYGQPQRNDGYYSDSATYAGRSYVAYDPRNYQYNTGTYRQPFIYDVNRIFDTGIRNYDNLRGYWNYYDYSPTTFSRKT